MRIPFIGQGSIGRSETVNSERLVNLYPQIDPTGKATIALYGCPGLDRLRVLGPGPSRAAIEYDGVLYVVSGDRFYSVNTSYVGTIRGNLNSGTGHVSMATNGLVILIVDGTQGWIYTIASNTFAQITDADFPPTPIDVDVLDNTFIVVEGGTQRIWTSTDGSTWEALQFASAETAPDDLIGMIVDHQELVLFGTGSDASTEIWYNSGATFTFARRSTIENGCASTACIAKADNGILWLDNKGIGRILRGYTDQRITTHQQEFRIAQHTKEEIAAASSFTYSDEGHMFWQLTVGDETFVYDIAANKWHERRYLITTSGNLGRHRANWCVRFNGINVVGDYENGKIYHYDLDTHTDDGDTIQAIGTYRHLDAEGRTVFYGGVEIECETGVGSLHGQGADPEIELRWSNDGGRTWTPWYQRRLGPLGQYKVRAKWKGLGSSNDRVFEFRITDPVKRTIANANIQASSGR